MFEENGRYLSLSIAAEPRRAAPPQEAATDLAPVVDASALSRRARR